jgi:diguanylate cyclase (GGDEF)-like protein
LKGIDNVELRAYFRILIKRWWILIPIFAITLIAVGIWTSYLPNIYATNATFVIRPRSELVLDNDFVRALDIVSRRVEINTTFAEVANSNMIRNQAAERLQLPAEKRRNLSVSGRVIGGTNVLEITVQGSDPVVVRNFANAAGIEIVNYVSGLYDVFELEPLDPAEMPGRPIRPNRTFNMLIGAALGLVLGVGVVFLVEYVETPHEEPGSFNILEPATGVYNKPYLLLRLRQEMHRAHRHVGPLSLGMIQIETIAQDQEYSSNIGLETFREARFVIENTLKEEVLLFRFDENIYTILMPETNEKDAKELMDQLKYNLAAFENNFNDGQEKTSMRITMGVLSVYDYLLDQEEILNLTLQALEQAKWVPGHEVVHYYIDKDTHINLQNNRIYQETI